MIRKRGDAFDAKGLTNGKLAELFALKQYKYLSYYTITNDYKQIDLFSNEDDTARFKSNVQFAVINQKKSEILSATPKYDFVPLDDDAKRSIQVFKRTWDYVWKVSHTDAEFTKILQDSLMYGAGFGIEEAKDVTRCVRMPYKRNGKIEWEEEDITDYSGCKLTHIPWNDVFINGRDMEEADEAIRIRHYPRQGAFDAFRKPFFNYKEDDIPLGRYYYVAPSGHLFLDGQLVTGITKIGNPVQAKEWVSVLEYWCKSKDQYVVMMNGVWINPMDNGDVMPLPYPHKEIPIVAYTDHFVPDTVYGLGEYEISARSKYVKDESRSLIIETAKAQMGVITIDPDSDFDEALMKFGPREMVRARRDEVSFFAPSISANSLQYLEAKADEDVIIETGVDFKNQLLAPQETATRAAGRVDAARKRISSHVKYNAFTFWERLARLRIANLQTWYDNPFTIAMYGEDAGKTKTSVEPMNGGYGTFTVTPDMLKGKIKALPVIDSLYGDSSLEKKQKYIEAIQMYANFVDPTTGKPLIHPSQIIEAGRGIMDDAIDIDKLLEKREDVQTPDKILGEIDSMDQGGMPGEAGMAGTEPGFIPPEQRSGKALLLGSSPNLQG